MATINKVIERAMKLHPDTIDDLTKCRWISELDGKIRRETMCRNDFVPYKFPEDGEKKLLLESPYDNIYELYIIAMSDFYSGELANYNASAALFTSAFTEFRKNYIRNNMPSQNEIRL